MTPSAAGDGCRPEAPGCMGISRLPPDMLWLRRHGQRVVKLRTACLACATLHTGGCYLGSPCALSLWPAYMHIGSPRKLRRRLMAFVKAMPPGSRRASLWGSSPEREMESLAATIGRSVLAALLLDAQGQVHAAALCENDHNVFGALHLIADPASPPDALDLLVAARSFTAHCHKLFPVLSMAIPRQWHGPRRLARNLGFAEICCMPRALPGYLRKGRRDLDMIICQKRSPVEKGDGTPAQRE